MSAAEPTAPRVALVTGASGGIGAATARALAAHGHAVVVGYRSSPDAASEVVDRITSDGGRASAACIDVTSPASVDEAFARIEADLGPVAILVNNAGATADGLFLRMTTAQWRTVLDTNLDGAFHVSHRAAPKMVRARWGRIVNISSVVGLLGSAGQANYAAAKAGLVGLSRSLARELGSRGITVNVVAPGPIATDMLAAAGAARTDDLASLVPLGRIGHPDDVAAAVAYLCSDAAAYVTGAVLPVDGGLGMGH